MSANISATDFLKNQVDQAMDFMPDYVSDLFMEATGVKQYMEEPSCSRSSTPYSPSTDGWNKEEPSCSRSSPPYSPSTDGWNKECPLDITLPEIPSNIPVSCHIPDYCTGIQCCVDVEFIKKSFHFYILLDGCQYRIKAGIDRFGIDEAFFSFDSGMVKNLKLGNIMFLDFMVIDLQAEKKFIISMNVSVCLEEGEACDITLEIVKDLCLPKIFCDWSINFNNFSTSNFLAQQGLSLQNQLTDIVVKQVLEKLGIAEYLQDPQCDINSPMYQSQPSDSVGWRDECLGGLVNLTALTPSSIATPKGYIASRCTYIDFCLYIPLLKKSFHAYFDLNWCERSFKIGIEKLFIDLDFLTYNWGQKDSKDLLDALIFDFLVDYNEVDEYFHVDLNMSMYLDRSEQYVTFELFKRQVLPIPACDYDTSYAVPGFNLNSWYAEEDVNTEGVNTFNTYQHIPLGSPLEPAKTSSLPLLTPVKASSLLEDLEIGEMMSPSQCQPSGINYSPSVGGWKNACPLDVPMATLHPSTVGSIGEVCTAVDFCSDVDFLGRPFHTYIDLDPCTNIGKIGIERFNLKLNLTDATIFGEEKKFNLKGVVKLTYKIETFPVERQYRVNLKIQICFNSTSLCEIEMDAFTDAMIPWRQCAWDLPYSTAGFSLASHLTSIGKTSGQTFSSEEKTDLFNLLGLNSYILGTPCTVADYSPISAERWQKDCAADVTLPTLPANAVCNIHDKCTAVDCCMNSDFLQQGFHSFVELDPCNHKLNFGIERVSETVDLNGYAFGVEQTKTLMNVVRLTYTIINLQSAGRFQLDMTIKICFETSGSCDFEMTVFSGTQLPKQYCFTGSTFLDSAFSLDNFLMAENEAKVDPLPSKATTKLLQDTGISDYLQVTPCDHSVSPFTTANGRLNDECGKLEDSITLPADVSLNIQSDCTSVTMCSNIGYIDKKIQSKVKIDPCTYEITLGIETMDATVSLLHFQWGKPQSFALQGGLRME
ncbi:uncharacterized protein LOC134727440 [Mytilus trossulus]|uniref:uncharacterized protein LOC134727440 n=1 Tax=Mytilus trossulus TaxID=6551 RepID=UPI0030059BC8